MVIALGLLSGLSGSGPAVLEAGVPTVTGDVDCGGSVDSVDAVLVLSFVAQLQPYAQCISVGDINCDDATDAIDALGILRYTAGLTPLNTGPDCIPIGVPLLSTLTIDKFGDGTIISSPAGIACGEGCIVQEAVFPTGTTIELVVAADLNWDFSHWSACDSASSNTCVITLDDDRTVLAGFALSQTVFPATTKVLDESTMQYFIRQEGSLFYFDAQADEIARLQTGDVILSMVGGGLLRRVVDVDITADAIVVETSDALLEDAIQEGTIQLRGGIAPDGPASTASVPGDVAGVPCPVSADIPHGELEIRESWEEGADDPALVVSGTTRVWAGATAFLEGEFPDDCGLLDAMFSFIDGRLHSALFLFTVDIRTELNVTLTRSLDFQRDWLIGQVPIGCAHGICAAFTLNAGVDAHARAELALNGEMGAKFTALFTTKRMAINGTGAEACTVFFLARDASGSAQTCLVPRT